MPGRGPKPANLMIIGEAPGKEEDSSSTPFVGRAGQLLDQMLEAAGLSPLTTSTYVTNACKCRPPDNRTPRPGEIKACRPYLEAEVAAVRPDYILLLGNSPLKAVLDETGITKHRGRPVKVNNTTIFPTLHPASTFYSEANRPIIEQDLRYLRDIMRHGYVPKEKGLRPVIVDSRAKVEQMLEALTEVVSLDLETTSLYPWHGQIVVVGFGTDKGEFALFDGHRQVAFTQMQLDDILARAATRLRKCFVVGQNIKFDQLWLLVHYGLFIEAAFDTMLAHYLLDENQSITTLSIWPGSCSTPRHGTSLWQINRVQLLQTLLQIILRTISSMPATFTLQAQPAAHCRRPPAQAVRARHHASCQPQCSHGGQRRLHQRQEHG